MLAVRRDIVNIEGFKLCGEIKDWAKQTVTWTTRARSSERRTSRTI